jgi:hypothetical protein
VGIDCPAMLGSCILGTILLLGKLNKRTLDIEYPRYSKLLLYELFASMYNFHQPVALLPRTYNNDCTRRHVLCRQHMGRSRGGKAPVARKASIVRSCSINSRNSWDEVR